MILFNLSKYSINSSNLEEKKLQKTNFSISIEAPLPKLKNDIDYISVIDMIFLYLKGKVSREIYVFL